LLSRTVAARGPYRGRALGRRRISADPNSKGIHNESTRKSKVAASAVGAGVPSITNIAMHVASNPPRPSGTGRERDHDRRRHQRYEGGRETRRSA